MRPSKVLTKLRNDQPVVLYCLHFTDPSVWEMTSLLGFDCIWFDMEHHAHNMETANNLFRAARVGTSDVISRPAKGEWMRMLRMLEAGAHGILYPRCQSVEEAREVVKWCKFAPLGERGFDGGNPDMPYCYMDMAEYVKFANDNTFVIIQIEDTTGLDAVEDIVAVEGVDGVMLGPGDFSTLGGFPGKFDDPRIQTALERIAAAADKAGKWWGSTAGNADRAKHLLDMGAKLIFSGADLVLVKNGLAEFQKNFAPLGITFDNQLEGKAGKSYMEKG